MFSFGGFSSILPYIGYLSVMWVCILIGASGQINRLIGTAKIHDQSIGIPTYEQKGFDEIAYFTRLNYPATKKSSELFANFLFLKYRYSEAVLYSSDESRPILYTKPCLTLHTLRAPPQTI